jgi:hypothetical protein
MNNQARLKKAGLIRAGHEFSKKDTQLIEKLSKEEIGALISARRKLGSGFLRKNTAGRRPPVGIVF